MLTSNMIERFAKRFRDLGKFKELAGDDYEIKDDPAEINGKNVSIYDRKIYRENQVLQVRFFQKQKPSKDTVQVHVQNVSKERPHQSKKKQQIISEINRKIRAVHKIAKLYNVQEVTKNNENLLNQNQEQIQYKQDEQVYSDGAEVMESIQQSQMINQDWKQKQEEVQLQQQIQEEQEPNQCYQPIKESMYKLIQDLNGVQKEEQRNQAMRRLGKKYNKDLHFIKGKFDGYKILQCIEEKISTMSQRPTDKQIANMLTAKLLPFMKQNLGFKRYRFLNICRIVFHELEVKSYLPAVWLDSLVAQYQDLLKGISLKQYDTKAKSKQPLNKSKKIKSKSNDIIQSFWNEGSDSLPQEEQFQNIQQNLYTQKKSQNEEYIGHKSQSQFNKLPLPQYEEDDFNFDGTQFFEDQSKNNQFFRQKSQVMSEKKALKLQMKDIQLSKQKNEQSSKMILKKQPLVQNKSLKQKSNIKKKEKNLKINNQETQISQPQKKKSRMAQKQGKQSRELFLQSQSKQKVSTKKQFQKAEKLFQSVAPSSMQYNYQQFQGQQRNNEEQQFFNKYPAQFLQKITKKLNHILIKNVKAVFQNQSQQLCIEAKNLVKIYKKYGKISITKIMKELQWKQNQQILIGGQQNSKIFDKPTNNILPGSKNIQNGALDVQNKNNYQNPIPLTTISQVPKLSNSENNYLKMLQNQISAFVSNKQDPKIDEIKKFAIKHAATHPALKGNIKQEEMARWLLGYLDQLEFIMYENKVKSAMSKLNFDQKNQSIQVAQKPAEIQVQMAQQS